MALKFYRIVAKQLKLNAKKFLWLIRTFVEVAEEKLIGGAFFPHPECFNQNVPYVTTMQQGTRIIIEEWTVIIQIDFFSALAVWMH